VSDKETQLDILAKALEEVLAEIYGKRLGFALFMFPWGEAEGEAGDYVSNSTRETMIKFMREVADRLEAGEEIPRTVGQA
jgi:hypothetical protein